MTTPKFDNNTPGVSEVIVIITALLVEMKEASSMADINISVLEALHPEKKTTFPVVNFRCNWMFHVLVGISLEDETYGVSILGYPITSVPPFNNIPREAEGLKALVKELIEKERASWV